MSDQNSGRKCVMLLFEDSGAGGGKRLSTDQSAANRLHCVHVL